MEGTTLALPEEGRQEEVQARIADNPKMPHQAGTY